MKWYKQLVFSLWSVDGLLFVWGLMSGLLFTCDFCQLINQSRDDVEVKSFKPGNVDPFSVRKFQFNGALSLLFLYKAPSICFILFYRCALLCSRALFPPLSLTELNLRRVEVKTIQTSALLIEAAVCVLMKQNPGPLSFIHPWFHPDSSQLWLITFLCLVSTLMSFHPLSLPYIPVVARATALTCRPMFPWARGAIRGLSTTLFSCYKWCWRDGEGPRLCFEGQQGRSSALCQWLLGPSAATPAR